MFPLGIGYKSGSIKEVRLLIYITVIVCWRKAGDLDHFLAGQCVTVVPRLVIIVPKIQYMRIGQLISLPLPLRIVLDQNIMGLQPVDQSPIMIAQTSNRQCFPHLAGFHTLHCKPQLNLCLRSIRKSSCSGCKGLAAKHKMEPILGTHAKQFFQLVSIAIHFHQNIGHFRKLIYHHKNRRHIAIRWNITEFSPAIPHKNDGTFFHDLHKAIDKVADQLRRIINDDIAHMGWALLNIGAKLCHGKIDQPDLHIVRMMRANDRMYDRLQQCGFTGT